MNGELESGHWAPGTGHCSSSDPAAILFTTGSTGPPKGVVYRHATFQAQVDSLRTHFGLHPGQIDLATFPLFALFDAALGVTAVIPAMNPTRPGFADPRGILRTIQQSKCTNMFASPALLDRVGRYGGEHGVTLPLLRRVTTAGAPVRPDILERFAALLSEGAEIVTAYGATEALPVASIGHREILASTRRVTATGGGVCVGRAVGDVQVRVIRITDEPIGEWSDDLVLPALRDALVEPCGGVRDSFGGIASTKGWHCQAYSLGSGPRAQPTANGIPLTAPPPQKLSRTPCGESAGNADAMHRLLAAHVGEIAVHGAMVSHEYFNNPAANALAKIRDSERIWHRMGDLGYFDAQGRLWMCGRKSHRVVTEQGTLFTECVEAIFNQHPQVRRTALVGVGPRPRQTPVLCVELTARIARRERPRIVRELRAMGERHTMTRSIETILFHRRFPVDIRHNAKIFREKLALWAARRRAAR